MLGQPKLSISGVIALGILWAKYKVPSIIERFARQLVHDKYLDLRDNLMRWKTAVIIVETLKKQNKGLL